MTKDSNIVKEVSDFFIDRKLSMFKHPQTSVYTLLRVPTVAPSPSSDHPQLVSVSVYTLCCCPLAPVSPLSTVKEGNSEVKKLKNGQISAFIGKKYLLFQLNKADKN